MGRRRPGSLVWLTSILAGIGLGAYVLAAWPEPTSPQVSQPQGVSMPKASPTAAKTPRKVEKRRTPVARAVASAAVTAPQAPRTAQAAPARELGGPPPVASELESDSYRPETAEQLGAEPLPGMDPTP